jgi:tRNA dimethylallyltransferase
MPSSFTAAAKLIVKFLAQKPGKPLIVILGPTASGKTALAIKLAKKFGGEIVSADSRMVYRGLDIGTAKPSLKERRDVPHHLIDIAKPAQNFSLAQFKRAALKAIREILKCGKIPFLVGGTGLYIDAVVENFRIPRVPPNPELRQQLEKRVEAEGTEALYQILKKMDPRGAASINPQNSRYLIRALEIALSGKKKSLVRGKPEFSVLPLGLTVPREKLYRILDARTVQQFRAGVIAETEKILQNDVPENAPALTGFVYREVIEHLKGVRNLEATIKLVQQKNRNYAKRQMTWFKRKGAVEWLRASL